jgi:hypothetical protein
MKKGERRVVLVKRASVCRDCEAAGDYHIEVHTEGREQSFLVAGRRSDAKKMQGVMVLEYTGTDYVGRDVSNSQIDSWDLLWKMVETVETV